MPFPLLALLSMAAATGTKLGGDYLNRRAAGNADRRAAGSRAIQTAQQIQQSQAMSQMPGSPGMVGGLQGEAVTPEDIMRERLMREIFGGLQGGG